MFIEFQVANFRSFRDLQKFSMQASHLRTNDSGLDEDHVFELNGFRLLRSKAIVGANASGKSNLAEAIAAFRVMVNRSVAEEDMAKALWEDRFKLITNWDDQPVFFQLTFLCKGKLFRYGFQILHAKVSCEWLFGMDNQNLETQIFFREDQKLHVNTELFQASPIMEEQLQEKDNELFRKDSLFLTSAALSGNSFSADIRNYIRAIVSVDGVNDQHVMKYAIYLLEKGEQQKIQMIKDFLKAADTGILDLEVKDQSNYSSEVKQLLISRKEFERRDIIKKLHSKHPVYDENGNFVENISVSFDDWESEGSAKLLSVGTAVIECLMYGGTLIIDEFDARFHPNLSLKIVEMFNDKDLNPLNGQLIFVTHDSTLLRRANLRRDQICLVDKDKYGISTATTLIEYKGVRKDASYEKDYLNGVYNAVPFLEELDNVITQNKDQ